MCLGSSGEAIGFVLDDISALVEATRASKVAKYRDEGRMRRGGGGRGRRNIARLGNARQMHLRRGVWATGGKRSLWRIMSVLLLARSQLEKLKCENTFHFGENLQKYFGTPPEGALGVQLQTCTRMCVHTYISIEVIL